jgi:hypothetical protein
MFRVILYKYFEYLKYYRREIRHMYLKEKTSLFLRIFWLILALPVSHVAGSHPTADESNLSVVSHTQKQHNIPSLTDEVLCHVFTFVPLTDILEISLVSSHWCGISNDLKGPFKAFVAVKTSYQT